MPAGQRTGNKAKGRAQIERRSAAGRDHFHAILRNRPDVVDGWSDIEVARRWYRICPARKTPAGGPEEPTEGRFKCVKLCDEAAILACGIYVDLSVIRAGCALSPETSEHTSAKLRIEARADWLAPLELDANLAPGPAPSERPERASDKGFLPMPLADYLDLLDWTGRQAVPGKRGTIPERLAPSLDRVGIPAESWLELSLGFGKLFHRVAGCPASIAREASRRSPRTFRAPGTRLFRAAHVQRR